MFRNIYILFYFLLNELTQVDQVEILWSRYNSLSESTAKYIRTLEEGIVGVEREWWQQRRWLRTWSFNYHYIKLSWTVWFRTNNSSHMQRGNERERLQMPIRVIFTIFVFGTVLKLVFPRLLSLLSMVLCKQCKFMTREI